MLNAQVDQWAANFENKNACLYDLWKSFSFLVSNVALRVWYGVFDVQRRSKINKQAMNKLMFNKIDKSKNLPK